MIIIESIALIILMVGLTLTLLGKKQGFTFMGCLIFILIETFYCKAYGLLLLGFIVLAYITFPQGGVKIGRFRIKVGRIQVIKGGRK